MTKKICFLCVLALLAAGPVAAQPHLKSVNRWINRLHLQEKQVLDALQKGLRRAWLTPGSKQKIPALSSRFALQNPQESVFLLRDVQGKCSSTFFASGFLVQETFQDKNYVWGITAKHIGDLYDGPIEAVFFVNNRPIVVPVQIAFTGAQYGIDISLLKLDIPAGILKPLSLGQDPQVGETLHSFGYARGKFYPLSSRKVLRTGTNRIFTSYAFSSIASGSGYCGSALVNEQGLLSAIHCGSIPDKSASFAVPVSNLRTLLAAYHGLQQGQRELRFNGHLIGKMNVRQGIYAVYVRRNGRVISKKHTEPQPYSGLHHYFSPNPDIARLNDPSHLEDGLKWLGADEVTVLVFEEPAEYFNPQEDPCKQTLYRYNLLDGTVTTSTFTGVLSLKPL